MLREIVLDTETTGVDALKGDRVIEIGCVELINHVPTGTTFHCYINPQYPVSAGAFNVHGLSDAFLADKPLFGDVVEEFQSFIAASPLIIHNAAFDVGFLNAELGRLGRGNLSGMVVRDTLAMARRKHPGASNSLDALCQRYGIDNSRRTKHGALMDAQILAEVYMELIGGKQTVLGLGLASGPGDTAPAAQGPGPVRAAPVVSALRDEEKAMHARYAGENPKSVWERYRT